MQKKLKLFCNSYFWGGPFSDFRKKAVALRFNYYDAMTPKQSLIWEKSDKNFSNENYAKLINYLSKMKELDQIVLLKGLFNKTAPLFEKWALEQGRMTCEG